MASWYSGSSFTAWCHTKFRFLPGVPPRRSTWWQVQMYQYPSHLSQRGRKPQRATIFLFSTIKSFSSFSPRVKCLISSSFFLQIGTSDLCPGFKASWNPTSNVALVSSCHHSCVGYLHRSDDRTESDKIHIRNAGEEKQLPSIIVGAYRKDMNNRSLVW